MQGSYTRSYQSPQPLKPHIPPRKWSRLLTIMALACTLLLIASHFQYITANVARVQHSRWNEDQPGRDVVDIEPTITISPEVPIETARSEVETTSSVASTLPSTTKETATSKIIVMGRLSTESTSWVSELPDWQSAIYAVDTPANSTLSPGIFRTSINKAHEAMPYLTYIASNYPNFPDVVAFVHAHRDGYPKAWHNDAEDHSAVIMLQNLRLDTIKTRGYVNLRCNDNPGCPAEIEPFRQDLDAGKQGDANAFLDMYGVLFNKTRTEMAREIPTVATPCCAQFAVSREQILARPKQDYEHYLHVLERTGYSDYTSGRIMEYVWHMMFGQKAVHCVDMEVCYCDVFGRCDL